MSKFERFITMNGRVDLALPLVFLFAGILASVSKVPYVDYVMMTFAAVLLIVGLFDLVISEKKKRVD